MTSAEQTLLAFLRDRMDIYGRARWEPAAWRRHAPEHVDHDPLRLLVALEHAGALLRVEPAPDGARDGILADTSPAHLHVLRWVKDHLDARGECGGTFAALRDALPDLRGHDVQQLLLGLRDRGLIKLRALEDDRFRVVPF